MKNLLSDVQCRKAKCPPGKQFKRFADGEGLYLTVFASGGKSFQFRYKQHNGKETIETLKGIDSLADARVEADRLRKSIAAGDDPRVLKEVARVEKIAANGQTFEVTKDAWIEQEARRQQWTPDYIESVKAAFENHLKDLNPIPVTKIVARTTAPMLREVEKNAPGVVDRLAARLHAVMEFAREEGYFEVNPIPRRRRAKPKDRAKATHFAAVTDLPGVGELLRAFDGLIADRAKHFRKSARESIRRAHLLLVFTGMRISEVVNAQWKEFDLDAGLWAIPRERMKIKNPERGPHHIVPLPPKLLAQLREWRAADAKSAVFVCPSARNPKTPILDVQVGAFYRDDLELTGKHSPHSWRAVFKTVCKEARKEFDLIESQLDHIAGNAVAAAYDRSRLLEPRRQLMTWYEETIIAARDGAKVLPLKKQV